MGKHEKNSKMVFDFVKWCIIHFIMPFISSSFYTECTASESKRYRTRNR
ncbi:MAG: hypothetical protein HFI05_14310 [Lachnospiraceae bacterium]|nr:hypothetical protein [Lachnospiraceae bacterium]